MAAAARHVTIVSDLFADATLALLILKYLRKLGCVPARQAARQPGSRCGPDPSADSSTNCAGHADPYLHQNTDLCPLFHPVSFCLNNGELARPTVGRSANTASPRCHAGPNCHFVSMPPCMFPRCLISHFVDGALHIPVRGVCVLGASSQACQDVRGPAAASGQQEGATE